MPPTLGSAHIPGGAFFEPPGVKKLTSRESLASSNWTLRDERTDASCYLIATGYMFTKRRHLERCVAGLPGLGAEPSSRGADRRMDRCVGDRTDEILRVAGRPDGTCLRADSMQLLLP